MPNTEIIDISDPIGERTYPLSPEERQPIDEMIATARALNSQAEGALKMLCSIRRLSGNWDYTDGILRKRD